MTAVATPPMPEDYVARFWGRVRKDPGGCWLWTGPTDNRGYGRATVRRRTVMLAHRAAWLITLGELEDDRCVLHRCDTPKCVNPAHLFLGDRGDNARDMASKGRQWLQQRPDLALRGESHPGTFLTEEQVREIRRRRSRGERLRPLSQEFGATETTISNIARRVTWAHVEEAA